MAYFAEEKNIQPVSDFPKGNVKRKMYTVRRPNGLGSQHDVQQILYHILLSYTSSHVTLYWTLGAQQGCVLLSLCRLVLTSVRPEESGLNCLHNLVSSLSLPPFDHSFTFNQTPSC